MNPTLLIVACTLSCTAGDISEKLRLGQAISGPGPSSQFGGLLAPFADGPANSRGLQGGQLESSSAARKPVIPFQNHDGKDDDENNLDRLCKDAFHSFLCKPVGPRTRRIDGKLRPGARIPPGAFVGSSSNVQPAKTPFISGGALLPTELDDEGPSPSSVVSGYSYPKPQFNGYTYDKPQIGFPSQLNPVVKPSNEYLPAFITSTSTSPPITLPPTTTPAPSYNFGGNQISSQTNVQPVVSYESPKPANPILLPSASQDVGYSYPKPANPILLPSASQDVGYSYPKPANQLIYRPVPSSQTPLFVSTTTPRPIPSTFPPIRVEYTSPTSTTPLPTFLPAIPIPSQSINRPIVVNQAPYSYSKPSNPFLLPSQAYTPIQQPNPSYFSPAVSTTSRPTIVTSPPRVVYTSPTSTTLRPFLSFNSPVPSQTNLQPIVLNQAAYQYPRPSVFSFPPAPISVPVVSQPTITYSYPQTTLLSTPAIPISPPPTSPGIKLSYSAASTVLQPSIVYNGYPSFPPSAPTVIGNQPVLQSNDNGYIYPQPSNNNQFVLPTSVTPAPTPPPTLPPSNGYLPPIGAPVPKESINVYNSLAPPRSPLFPMFSSPVTSTTRRPTFQFTTPRPYTFPSTFATLRPAPVTFSTTTRPVITTLTPTTPRPFRYQTTAAPLVSVTTLRPFVSLNQLTQTTPRPFTYSTTTFKPAVSFASSNDVRVFSPVQHQNAYLPPVGQPVPAAANEFPSVLPFIQSTTTTPRPTPPPQPSREYLPQLDIRSSSSNLSPNFEGGSLLAEEADAPSSERVPPPERTTERTHTKEEFCRDAFHSFLCKPIDKPRKRIDGRIRPGAVIPPNVSIGAGSSRPNQAGGALLSNVQNQYRQQAPSYQSTNLSPQLLFVGASQPSNFLLSESDSSTLAKYFSRPAKQNVVAEVSASIEKAASDGVPAKPVSTTTRPSTLKPRYTTTSSIKVSLQAAASAAPKEPLSPAPSELIQGYQYQAQRKPFAKTNNAYLPPKKTGTTRRPTTRYAAPQEPASIAGRPQFGQKLSARPKVTAPQDRRPEKQNQQDPGLPPASQFEILKP